MSIPGPTMKSGPSPFRQALQRGEQQVKARDYVNALHSFGDAVALKPDSAQARSVAASSSIISNSTTRPCATLPMPFAWSRPWSWRTLRWALSGTAASRSRSIGGISARTRIERQCAHGALRRGDVYMHRRQFAAAIADYSKLLQTNPRYAPAYQNRAAARQAMGDFVGAAEANASNSRSAGKLACPPGARHEEPRPQASGAFRRPARKRERARTPLTRRTAQPEHSVRQDLDIDHVDRPVAIQIVRRRYLPRA